MGWAQATLEAWQGPKPLLAACGRILLGGPLHQPVGSVHRGPPAVAYGQGGPLGAKAARGELPRLLNRAV